MSKAPSFEFSSMQDNHDQYDTDDEDEKMEQDIEEVFFLGNHADVGGGWKPDEADGVTLAHIPLTWLVREAQKAGLVFNPDKLKDLNCHYEEAVSEAQTGPAVPNIELNDEVIPDSTGDSRNNSTADQERQKFLDKMHSSCNARIHDSLSRSCGMSTMSVLAWNLMEYLPFQRMDLHNGQWKAIRWPLPLGEVRDIPDDVKVRYL